MKAVGIQQATLAQRLGLVSVEAAKPVIAELERLALKEQTIQQERDALRRQWELWEDGQAQGVNIMAWCQTVAQELDTFTCQAPAP